MDLTKKFQAAHKMIEMHNIWFSVQEEIYKSITRQKIVEIIMAVFFFLLFGSCFFSGFTYKSFIYLFFLTYFIWSFISDDKSSEKLDEIFVPKFKLLLTEMEFEHFKEDRMDTGAQNHIKRSLKKIFDLYLTALVEELNKHDGRAFETHSDEITFVRDKESQLKISEVAEKVKELTEKFSNNFGGIAFDCYPSVLCTRTLDGKERTACFINGYKIFGHSFRIKIV